MSPVSHDCRRAIRPRIAAAVVRYVAGLGVAALPLAAQPAVAPGAAEAAGGPRPIDRLTLVRCMDGRSMPCVRARVTVDPAMETHADAAARWTGTLGPYTLQPVGERVTADGGPPRAVFVLIDASGSMAGEGVQTARAAARSFLRDLGAGTPAGAVRAGVAAFASRGVAAGIRAALFGPSDAAARAIDALAPPAGNTGLYSAVAAGAERAAAEARTLGPAARAALVVVTDGRNDVRDATGRARPGDDPGLLDGVAGRTTAAELARRLGVALYFVGVGSEPDMAELEALAGRGRARRTALDAVALQEALADIERALRPGREATFVVLGADRTSLTGVGWPIELVRGAGRSPARFVGRWQAPLLTAPAFDGVAFTVETAPAWLRDAEQPGLGQRGMVAVFLVALGVGAWWLPRALWSAGDRSDGTVPAAGAMTSSGLPRPRTVPLVRPAAGGGAALVGAGAAPSTAAPGEVRSDVREAAPRLPSDATGEFAVPVDAGRGSGLGRR